MKVKSLSLLKIVCISVLTLIVTSVHAKGKMSYNGYAGGMMLHTGYVFGGESTPMHNGTSIGDPIGMSGLPMGIGGAIRFCFGDYLRIGTEGYSTTLGYNHNASYSTIGWGGLLADCTFRVKEKHLLFVGVTVGGGSCKNLTLTDDTLVDWEVESYASFRKYGFMAVTPFLGYEYVVTPKIHLAFKVDYLLNVTNPQPDFCTGPRVYVGFFFCRGPKNG